jgi:hypothetical protein
MSISGGSAVLSRGPIPPGTMGDIALRTMFGKVTAHIEFLQTCADGVPLAQAFRFLAMEEKSSERLLAATQMMEQEGLSDLPPTKSSSHPASEALSLLANSMRRLAAHLIAKR